MSKPRTADAGRSRITALIRLGLTVWLIWGACATLLNPETAAADSGQSVQTSLLLAALSFTLGIFLLSGFMSRIGGVILAALGIWELATGHPAFGSLVLVIAGLYLVLRGGGAWAMDIYVQKMQDRVRAREARERAEAESARASAPESRVELSANGE